MSTERKLDSKLVPLAPAASASNFDLLTLAQQMVIAAAGTQTRETHASDHVYHAPPEPDLRDINKVEDDAPDHTGQLSTGTDSRPANGSVDIQRAAPVGETVSSSNFAHEFLTNPVTMANVLTAMDTLPSSWSMRSAAAAGQISLQLLSGSTLSAALAYDAVESSLVSGALSTLVAAQPSGQTSAGTITAVSTATNDVSTSAAATSYSAMPQHFTDLSDAANANTVASTWSSTTARTTSMEPALPLEISSPASSGSSSANMPVPTTSTGTAEPGVPASSCEASTSISGQSPSLAINDGSATTPSGQIDLASTSSLTTSLSGSFAAADPGAMQTSAGAGTAQPANADTSEGNSGASQVTTTAGDGTGASAVAGASSAAPQTPAMAEAASSSSETITQTAGDSNTAPASPDTSHMNSTSGATGDGTISSSSSGNSTESGATGGATTTSSGDGSSTAQPATTPPGSPGNTGQGAGTTGANEQTAQPGSPPTSTDTATQTVAGGVSQEHTPGAEHPGQASGPPANTSTIGTLPSTANTDLTTDAGHASRVVSASPTETDWPADRSNQAANQPATSEAAGVCSLSAQGSDASVKAQTLSYNMPCSTSYGDPGPGVSPHLGPLLLQHLASTTLVPTTPDPALGLEPMSFASSAGVGHINAAQMPVHDLLTGHADAASSAHNSSYNHYFDHHS